MTGDHSILQFPNKTKIQDEAARWVLLIDRGQLTPIQKLHFDEWMQVSELHEAAFLEARIVWGDLDAVSSLSELLDLPEIARPNSKPYRTRTFGAVCASILIFASIYTSFNYWGNPHSTAEQVQKYHTGVGGLDRVKLRDGSTLNLNTATTVYADVSDHRRNLTVAEGEIYLKVERDENLPFSVDAGQVTVDVLGTTFSIKRAADTTEVVVVEGLVRVTSKLVDGSLDYSNAVVLHAGQRLLNAGKDGTAQVTEIAPQKLSRRLLWQDGMLAFDGETLAEVIAEFSRYTDIKLTIEDATTAEIRVGGYFRSDDVSALLASLEQNFSVSADQIEVNTFLLKQKQN